VDALACTLGLHTVNDGLRGIFLAALFKDLAMLTGINPDMPPDLLDCMMRMGHGDEIVIADANFPATSTAKSTVIGHTLYLPAFSAPEAARLITEMMPLDGYWEACAYRMEIDNDPETLGDVHIETLAILENEKPDLARIGSIERQEFYPRAAQSYAIVQTGESRPFGCFILRKGVIF